MLVGRRRSCRAQFSYCRPPGPLHHCQSQMWLGPRRHRGHRTRHSAAHAWALVSPSLAQLGSLLPSPSLSQHTRRRRNSVDALSSLSLSEASCRTGGRSGVNRRAEQ